MKHFNNTLSLAYEAQGLPELKIECYQKALHLPYCTRNGKVTYYSNIATTYLGEGKDLKAIPFADSALAIDSADAFALKLRGRAELGLGRDSSAKRYFDRAFATDWQERLDKGLQVFLLYDAARCEYRLEEYDAALDHVLKALEIRPSSSERMSRT